MQDPKRSECGWWSEGSRIVSGHSGEGQKNVTQIARFSLLIAASSTVGCSSDRLSRDPPRGLRRRASGSVLDLFPNFDRVRGGVRRAYRIRVARLACSAPAADESVPGRHRRSHARVDAAAAWRIRVQFPECRAAVRRRSGVEGGLGRRRQAIAGASSRRGRRSRRSSRRSRNVAARHHGRAKPARGLPILARLSIATGQQAGAFGGPLFTLLKAVTAIQLSERGVGASTVCRSCRCSGSTPKITTGKRCAAVPCSMRSFSRRPITLADPEGAGELPVAHAEAGRRASSERSTNWPAVLAATDFTRLGE